MRVVELPDGAVDGAVSTLALHHFADQAPAFREMARVAGSVTRGL